MYLLIGTYAIILLLISPLQWHLIFIRHRLYSYLINTIHVVNNEFSSYFVLKLEIIFQTIVRCRWDVGDMTRRVWIFEVLLWNRLQMIHCVTYNTNTYLSIQNYIIYIYFEKQLIFRLPTYRDFFLIDLKYFFT